MKGALSFALLLSLLLSLSAFSAGAHRGSVSGNFKFVDQGVQQDSGYGKFITPIRNKEGAGVYIDGVIGGNATGTLTLESSVDNFYEITNSSSWPIRPGKERYILQESLKGKYTRAIIEITGRAHIREVKILEDANTSMPIGSRSIYDEVLIFVGSILAGVGIWKGGTSLKKKLSGGSSDGD